jgi:hypothetical protein
MRQAGKKGERISSGEIVLVSIFLFYNSFLSRSIINCAHVAQTQNDEVRVESSNSEANVKNVNEIPNLTKKSFFSIFLTELSTTVNRIFQLFHRIFIGCLFFLNFFSPREQHVCE